MQAAWWIVLVVVTVGSMLPSLPQLYPEFFCRYEDPSYLKALKASLLSAANGLQLVANGVGGSLLEGRQLVSDAALQRPAGAVWPPLQHPAGWMHTTGRSPVNLLPV